MAITVSFACNDYRNGNCAGKFSRMDVDGGILHMEFEGDEKEIEYSFRDFSGYGKVTVAGLELKALGYHNWVGNWCWDAVSLTWVETLEAINHLGKMGWRMTEGPTELFEAYNERHEITPTEWKTDNESR